MHARFAVLAIATALLGACDASAGEVLRATTARLPEIRSGEMHLESSIATDDAATGFTLDGVFSLPTEAGALPEADLSYSQIVGEEEASGRFVSDGSVVFVEIEGERIELPPDQVESLRVSGTEDAPSLFEGLAVEGWIDDAELASDGAVDRITGSLDVVTAMNDLIAVAQRFGSAGALGLQSLDEAAGEQVSNAVRDSSIEIATGAEDRLLRELHIRVEFATPDADLAEALGPLGGAIFELTLEITNPNSGVDVT